jgi:hypothetical protein
MKRHSCAASLALAVLLALGLTGPAAAEEPVPFSGRLAGDATVEALVPPFVLVTTEATGHATHLGRFTYTELATVNTQLHMGTGTFLFTAANGDRVFGTNHGRDTLTAPDVLTIVEEAIITGGTGRFAGSTGSFTSTRLRNLVTEVVTGSFEGTMRLRDDDDAGDDD